MDRFSQPYFFDPSVHAVVAPLPGLGPAAGEGEGEGFEPVRYGDYLMERLDAKGQQRFPVPVYPQPLLLQGPWKL